MQPKEIDWYELKQYIQNIFNTHTGKPYEHDDHTDNTG